MRRGEAGISAVEYALLAALIGVGIIASLLAVSGNLASLWNSVATAVGS